MTVNLEDIQDKLVPISTAAGPMHVIAPLPPSQDTTPDQIAFFNRPNAVPFVRHSPLPVAAHAPTNAVAKTIAKEVVASSAPAPTQPPSVELTMPVQYTVTETTSGSDEEIDVAWVPVPSNYALMGPGPIPSLMASNSLTGAGTSITISTQPSGTGTTWALFVEFSNNNLTAGQPAGWTQLSSTSSQNVFSKTQTGSAPYVATAALSGATSFAVATLVFTGAIPAIAQSIPQVITGTAGTVVMSSVTAGNVLFVIIQGYNGDSSYSFTVTDTQGNLYYLVSDVITEAAGFNPAISQGIFICPSAIGGSNTVNVAYLIDGPSGSPVHKEVFVMEMSPLTVGPGDPFFRQITPSDAPSLQSLKGIVSVAKGGTGANLTATGGTSEVLQQTTAGGAVTVGQLGYTDLSGNLGSAILTASAPTVAASQIGIGNGTATSATTGANGAVPAQVVGYLIINVAGTAMKIPYFNT